jgi:hypothetical protein
MQPKKLNEINDDAIPLFGLIYGPPGVGKTTCAAGAKNAFYADMQYGTKFFKKRGMFPDLTVQQVRKWPEVREVMAKAIRGEYETVIFDALEDLVDALIDELKITCPKNFKDGSPTPAGWGMIGDNFKRFTVAGRDAGVNILIIGHSTEKSDGDKMVLRPKAPGSSGETLVKHLDFEGYFDIIGGERVIHFEKTENFHAKNRASDCKTLKLGGIEEGWDLLYNALQ